MRGMQLGDFTLIEELNLYLNSFKQFLITHFWKHLWICGYAKYTCNMYACYACYLKHVLQMFYVVYKIDKAKSNKKVI